MYRILPYIENDWFWGENSNRFKIQKSITVFGLHLYWKTLYNTNRLIYAKDELQEIIDSGGKTWEQRYKENRIREVEKHLSNIIFYDSNGERIIND